MRIKPLALLVFLLMLPATRAWSWNIETVDNGVAARAVAPRAIALDSVGQPQVILGGDGLRMLRFDGNDWIYEFIDDAIGAGFKAAMALDSNDAAHIVYFNKVAGEIRYASDQTGPWVTQLVATVSTYETYLFVDIALDTANEVHIAYSAASDGTLRYANSSSGFTVMQASADNTQDLSIATTAKAGDVRISYHTGDSRDLKLATNESGAFTSITLDATGYVGATNCIAVDASNRTHITYHDSTNEQFKRAYQGDVGWITEVIDSDGNPGTQSSLTVDGNNKLHVVYKEISTAEIRYANNVFGEWSIQPLHPSANGDRASIAVNPAGTEVHVTFRQFGTLAYRYAVNTGSGFSIDTLAPSADVGLYTSIALDSTGRSHIAYRDDSAGSLKLASQIGPATWRLETVLSVGNVGVDTSLAVDANDALHVAFQNIASQELLYATDATGDWQIETVDSGGGAFATLAIDEGGQIHIAYRKGAYLRYAHGSLGSWAIETVDGAPGNEMGPYASLKLDSNGAVHIAYRAHSLDQLKYASNAGGSWISQVVDPGPQVGRHNALVIDTAGNAHIIYHNQAAEALGYATNSGGTWTTELAASGQAEGTDMLVDEQGTLHAVYSVYDDIYYLSGGSNAWTSEKIQNGGTYGSLDMDSHGGIHVGFYYGPGNDLRYASNAVGLAAEGPVDFGDTYVGTATERVLIVSNIGAIDQSINASITGASANEFHLDASCSLIEVDQSCTFILSFAPAATGSHSAALEIGELSIALSGVGLDPASCSDDSCGGCSSSSSTTFGNLLVVAFALWLFRRRRVSVLKST